MTTPRRRKSSKAATSDQTPEALPPQTLFKIGLEAQRSQDALAFERYERARKQRYRDLFNTALGREVLADYLMTIGFFAASPPTVENVANYRNGMRDAGATLLEAMGVDDADALTRAILNDNVNEVFNEEA